LIQLEDAAIAHPADAIEHQCLAFGGAKIGVMGGQQIASVGKIIQVQTSYLQFPLAAANAVILLAVVLMIIWGLTRLVDIRKEL